MSNSINATGPADDLSQPSAADDDIVSVNSKAASRQGNRAAKAAFILVSCAILVGILAWLSQSWLSAKKESLKTVTARTSGESPDLLNPEKPDVFKKLKVGVDADAPPAASVAPLGAASSPSSGIRPMRGPDGKIMLNSQGRALGVDPSGNIVEVPAIVAMGGDQAGKKALPGQPAYSPGADGQPKPPSRYGGALFVDGAATPVASPQNPGPAGQQTNADVIRALVGGQTPIAASPAFNLGAPFGESPNSTGASRPGSVGSQLVSGSTPVTRAKKSIDQNLAISKGRQADCVLTGRIIDETPGYTSCTLTQNLYSDNGRVLLLERGSDLIGEYGTSSQPGMRRLFVTWTRVKTPSGIDVDLSSPGSDALGTAGIPGQLDNRWGERIGAALLLSFIKDVAVAVIANQNKESASTGNSVTIQQQQPGTNTSQAGFTIADEVVRQTIKVRPTLTINEGDRISVYVARDLDFTSVYALRSAGISGAARLQ